MAKTKQDYFDDAVAAGHVAADADIDSFTVEQLRETLTPAAERPVWEGSLSATEPIVAPDGHVVLSQEDIDAREEADAS